MASQMPGDAPTPNTMNPYQMRFDLLHLAKDILEQNAHMAREDKVKDTNKDGRKTFFTTDEVIETADKLNKFLSGK
jgi:hypothetical protein|tara:strand:- start:472 stop:699 length:228 start_codon:yes stop_codon:yes gene_type:complete